MDLRTRITLIRGRDIYLSSLNQWQTYGGLLEGIPTIDLNRRIIERTFVQASQNSNAVHVVFAPETPIDDSDYRFGKPATLDPITCVGQFESNAIGESLSHGSVLTLIWFQPQFAFPISDPALTAIQTIDWVKYAQNFSL
jgi:hypothetical protein